MYTKSVVYIVFLQCVIENSSCKESYVLLPKSLKVCDEKMNNRVLTITKQISLNFHGTESLSDVNETKSLRYVCQVIVKPLGRYISIPYNGGRISFWKLRLKMSYTLDCKSTLTLEFLKEEKGYAHESASQMSNIDDKPVTHVYGCYTESPIIMNANNRKMSISWHTDDLNSLDSQSIDIELSTYMNFEGNFTIEEMERNCVLQGFWCGPIVQVCINAQMHCDEADSCFDGGSDEQGCPPPRNVSHHRLNSSRPQKNSWTSLIPWIFVGSIPFLLLLAMVLICSQRRHGLDSFPSDVEDETFRNPDGLDEICSKHVEIRENHCSDLVGGSEGFSICYGGRMHRLSGDPRDSGSMDSCDSTNQWTNTTQYLSQESPGSNSAINTCQEIHSNFIELDEGASKTPLIGENNEMKPKIGRKIIECPGEVSPTLTNGSSINEASPGRVKSQLSVLTYCGSERSGCMVRSPSNEDEEILMNEFGAHEQHSEDSQTLRQKHLAY